MNDEITVIIASDHPIYRKGLLRIIENTPGLKVVGEANCGVAVVDLIRARRPRVAVLDMRLSGKDGLDLMRTVIEGDRFVEVVLLVEGENERLLKAALDIGIKGLVRRDDEPEEIVDSVKSVAAGVSFVSSALRSYLLNRNQQTEGLAENEFSLRRLTPTERRILRLIAEYKTNREIAKQLFVSIRTIENHRHNISQKLNLRGAHSLLKFALDHHSDFY
jgi:DNA-binding NarL/FixJ family response regulator